MELAAGVGMELASVEARVSTGEWGKSSVGRSNKQRGERLQG